MKKVFSLLFLTAFFCVAALGQQVKDDLNQVKEWVRLQSDNGEFSFEMPSDFFYFYDKTGLFISPRSSSQTYQYKEMQMLNASSGKTVMSVEIYEIASSKSYLNTLLENQNLEDSKNSDSQPKFIIKEAEKDEILDFRNKKNVKVSYITKLFASKKNLYVMTVINRGVKTKDFERFLASAKLNFTETNQSDDTKIVNISSLTPITIGQIGVVEEQIEKDDSKENVPPKPIQNIENPILFLSKPRANYTDSARTSNVKGTIRLRLTFSKVGRVSKIAVVSSLPKGLLRNAVFSALRIKYIPQEKDDKLIDTTNIVEYNFDIY